MGKTAPAKSSHTLHDSHRDECNVCDDLAGTQQGKEHWLMQCHPGCTQNGEGGKCQRRILDDGFWRWKMVCPEKTIFENGLSVRNRFFYTRRDKSRANLFFSHQLSPIKSPYQTSHVKRVGRPPLSCSGQP